jgi:hypothetical protein
MLRAGGSVSSAFALPVYPAPILVATAPFALIPAQAAGILFTGLMAAAMITGLRLLGVRDWRCIALALISWPSVFGLALGAVGPLLVLGIGVAWRWRQRLWPTALAVAGVLAAKLFPWTLPIWLLLTRRYRALALTAVLVALVMVVAWAVIGFAGLAAYPQMLSDLAYVERGAGVSLVSLLMAAGVAGGLAQALALAAAAAILALAYRRSQRPGGDEIALSLTLIAALAASPVVWPHYYVLLFVPIALASPRLSWLWFVPLLTTLAPAPQGVVALLGWMLVTALVTVGAARRLAVPTTSGASWRHESDLTAGPLTE